MSISGSSPSILSAASEADIDKAITLMLALPAREPENDASRKLLKALFRDAMVDAPAAGVGRALVAVARGALGHAFRPSPPELRLLIDKLMAPEREAAERARLAAEFAEPQQPNPGAAFVATLDDIAKQIDRLAAAMNKPRGFDMEVQRGEYLRTMRGMKLGVVIEVIDRIIDGRFERKHPTIMPRPAELGQLARKVRDETDKAEQRTARGGGGKLYRYKLPRSKILEHDVTREFGRELVDNGVHPRGSIWIPGPITDPERGTMYAPDPDWQKAVPA